MNSDYSYCKGTDCKKQKQCKRFLSNHILHFLPRLFIEYTSCIKSRFSMFDKLKDKS